MYNVSEIDGLQVIGAKDKVLGKVTHVLFHPSEPRVVGLEVQPPSLAYVVERRPRYLPLDTLVLSKESVAVVGEKPDSDGAAAKRLGFSWDDTVIWRFMEVLTESGADLGLVRDVRFDAEDGSVVRLSLTRGATADVAVGAQKLDGALAVGFDGEFVRVRNEAVRERTDGGVAAQAGRGAAVAKIAAEEVGKQAVEGAVAAAKAVKKADIPGKASRGWKSFKDGFMEGYKSEDD